MEYRSNFGLSNILGAWINRVIWAAILVIAILKFESNPNGLTILIIIVLIALTRIETDQLVVNDRVIEIRRMLLFDLLPIVTTIQKDQLKDIQIQGNGTVGSNILMNILPFGLKVKNRITFVLKDGKAKSFSTYTFIDELETFKTNCVNR